MKLAESLQIFLSHASPLSSGIQQDVHTQLLRAVQIRGSFPSSLSLLEKVNKLIDNPEATSVEVAQILRVDLILSLRLIALVNLEYYSKGKVIHSVSNAVDNLGLIKLKEVLASLAEAKNFNAIFLGRAAALGTMQQGILAAVIARDIGNRLGAGKEAGDLAYLIAVLSNTAPLLLAYYYPHIFSGISLACRDNYENYAESFERVLGRSLGLFASDIAKSIALPADFVELAQSTDLPPWDEHVHIPAAKGAKSVLAAVAAANRLAHEICYFSGIQGIQSLIQELEATGFYNNISLEDILSDIGNTYTRHTDSLFLKPMRLPAYLSWFAPEVQNQDTFKWRDKLPNLTERINPFLYDLRSCFKVKSAENPEHIPHFPQAVNLTLNALIKGLNFDRAVFLQVEEDLADPNLVFSISFGVKLFQPEEIRRSLISEQGDQRPDVSAFHQQSPHFEGQPIFDDGWPFAAFPAIFKGRVIGIFYADRIRRPDANPLSSGDKIACTALAEEWRDLPLEFN